MNKLEEICTRKREHIAKQQSRVSLASVEADAKAASAPRGFHAALKARVAAGKTGLIAEVKKASPSKGIIREDFHPAQLATAYEAGGAACLSVLTDAPYFQGEDAFLVSARAATTLPVLRKDFMLEPYQIAESRALGADCVLLIMAALSDAQAKTLEATAMEYGMDVLVEVHDRPELERALTHLRSPLLGINNRSLKTLQVDIATSEMLGEFIPTDYTRVCESGIFTPADISRMKRADFHCFLVGEALMVQADIAAATQSLLQETV